MYCRDKPVLSGVGSRQLGGTLQEARTQCPVGAGCTAAARPHSCPCHVVAFSPRQHLPAPSRGRAPSSPLPAALWTGHTGHSHRPLHRHAHPGWWLKVCPGPSEPGPSSLFSTPASFQLCHLFHLWSVFTAFECGLFTCTHCHICLRRVALTVFVVRFPASWCRRPEVGTVFTASSGSRFLWISSIP